MLDMKMFHKHATFAQTGIMWADLEDVKHKHPTRFVYYYPNAEAGKQLEVVNEKTNTHYGYAHVGEDGLIHDNANRNVWRLV